jgi:hypothetical protein
VATVVVAATRWTRVTPVDPEDAGRLYPIVWSLEHLAMLPAGANLGERELASMQRWNARLRAALDAGEPVEASGADAHVLQVFIDAAGTSRKAAVSWVCAALSFQVPGCWSSLSRPRSVDCHTLEPTLASRMSPKDVTRRYSAGAHWPQPEAQSP